MTIAELEPSSEMVDARPASAVLPKMRPDDQLHAHRWLLVDGDQVREVTVAPAMTLAEVQLIYPGAEVRLDTGGDSAGVHEVEPVERDASLHLSPPAVPQIVSEEEFAWFMRPFLIGDVEAMLDKASDVGAITMASFMVDHVAVPAPLQRVLAALVPAMLAPYGSEANRAKHARSILRLVTADPSVREKYQRWDAR